MPAISFFFAQKHVEGLCAKSVVTNDRGLSPMEIAGKQVYEGPVHWVPQNLAVTANSHTQHLSA